MDHLVSNPNNLRPRNPRVCLLKANRHSPCRFADGLDEVGNGEPQILVVIERGTINTNQLLNSLSAVSSMWPA